MIRRDYMYSAFAYPLSPVPCYAHLRAAYVPRCRSAEAYDYLRTNKDKLLAQVRQARNRFFIGRRPVVWRTAFHYIRYINIIARQIDRRKHLVKQLPGSADKRNTLRVFISPRPFAHKHYARPWIPITYYDICARCTKTA